MSTKTQPEVLDAVIARIYDAALDATKWPNALDSAAEVAGCAASELGSSMTTHGAGYRLTAKVPDGRQISANSALQATATTHQITLLQRLTPHLRRAIQIAQQLGHMNQHLKIFQEVVDRLPIGVIILNSAGTIEFMNREAVRIGSGADGLAIRMNSVSAHYRAENAVLRGFISESLQPAASGPGAAGGTLSVSRPSGRRAFSVLVSRLPQHSMLMSPDRSAAVIFVTDPERQRGAHAEQVQHLYGLTASEGRLAAALAAGVSLADYARAGSVTLNTVRGHLKNIFGKTGTHSQTQLVRLIVSDLTTHIDGNRLTGDRVRGP